MQYDSKRTLIIFVVILLVILVLQILPFRVPYKIKVPGKIIPEKEWILQRGNDGSLMATFYDHKIGLVKNYSAAQIERGDAINFQLWPSLNEKEFINSGDTVGVIQSKEIDFQLQELNRDLVTTEASLEINRTGEKQPLILEAQEQLRLAKEKVKNQQMIFFRKDSLFKLNLISKEEYEVERSIFNVIEIEESVAKAHIEVLESGAKPELIEMIKVEIEAIRKQILSLHERTENFTMIAPFSGKLFRSFWGDTLLTVADTNFVVLLPIQLRHLNDIQVGQSVNCEIPNIGSRKLKIFHLEGKIKYINNQQVLVGLGQFEKQPAFIPINMIIPCSINIESLKILSYFTKYLKNVIN